MRHDSTPRSTHTKAWVCLIFLAASSCTTTRTSPLDRDLNTREMKVGVQVFIPNDGEDDLGEVHMLDVESHPSGDVAHGDHLLVTGWDLGSLDEDEGGFDNRATVAWWRDSDGELARELPLKGGSATLHDVVTLPGGDVILGGNAYGSIQLADTRLESGNAFAFAARVNPDDEIVWAKSWSTKEDYNSSELHTLVPTERGFVAMINFNGEVDQYSGMGGNDLGERVLIEELSNDGAHLNQYVIDGYDDSTRLTAATPLGDGTFALGLHTQSLYSDLPTLELTEGAVSPEALNRMGVLLRLDLARGTLSLIERWDGALEPEPRRAHVDLNALTTHAGDLVVAGALQGATTMGARTVSTRKRYVEPCASHRAPAGAVRLAIGGPSPCRPYTAESRFGFVQRLTRPR